MADKQPDRLTALERAVVEAVMEWGDWADIYGVPAEVKDAAEALWQARQGVIWTRRPMRDVRPGDRIRVPGAPGSERDVEHISPWRGHVDPRSSTYAPVAGDHENLRVRFTDTPPGTVQEMNPGFEVEIELPRGVVVAIEALGQGWAGRL